MGNRGKRLRSLLLAAGLMLAILPAQAQALEGGQITTMFAYNNSNRGNMFNVEVLGSSPVTIDSFDINVDSYGGALTLEVYYRVGGYSGYEGSPDAWTLLGSQTIEALGANNPTPLAVGGVTLTPGVTYGFYITLASESSASGWICYTDDRVALPDDFSDEHLKISIGLGNDTIFSTHNNRFPRAWNGTIYYSLGGGSGNSSFAAERAEENDHWRTLADAVAGAETGTVLNFDAKWCQSIPYWVADALAGKDLSLVLTYRDDDGGKKKTAVISCASVPQTAPDRLFYRPADFAALYGKTE